MGASAGHRACGGAVLSSAVMVWLHVVELLCASVAVQVRRVLLASLPLDRKSAVSGKSVDLGGRRIIKKNTPNDGVAGHSMVASAGQLTTVGALLSSTVMVWLHVVELLCASVAVQVRRVLLTSLPLSGRLASTKVTVRLVSQVSLNTGAPKAGVAGHSM